MTRETAYETPATPSAGVAHGYGPNVHILGDAYAQTRLARLCHDDVVQPEFSVIMRELYRHLATAVLNTRMPTRVVEQATRMAEAHPGGVFRGAVLDPETSVVCVDIARAGILPAQICYDVCNAVFDPARVRQDHLVMARTTDAAGHVTGADILGAKVGGGIDGRHVWFPDPMGATGSSLVHAISHYKAEYGADPASITVLNLIVTPEFLRAMQAAHPEVHVFAIRADRGASSSDVLQTALGERWDEESGLTDVQYIVPGGGGFGELMNNSYV